MLFRIAARSLVARRGRTLLTLGGLALAVAFLAALLGLSRGIADALSRHAEASFLRGEVILSRGATKSPSLLKRVVPGGEFFEEDDTSLPEIDENFLVELRAQPDVVRVVPQVPFPVPVTARAEVFGMHFEIDLPLFAVDDDFLERTGQTLPLSNPDSVPIVVSRRLLDVYNLGLAPTSSLPRLSESGLTGLHFDIELGFSSFLQSRPLGHTTNAKAEIVGWTDQPSLIGATTSRSRAEALLRELDPTKTFPETSRTVLVFAKDDAAAERVAAVYESRGYSATTLATILSGISASTATINTILAILASLVMLLALLTVAATMITATVERTEEIGVLRALGARKRDVARRFLLEALLLGLVAGILGMGLGILGALGVEALLHRILPDTSFLRSSIVTLDLVTLTVPIVAGALVAVLAALWPSLRAAQLPPVVALRDRS